MCSCTELFADEQAVRQHWLYVLPGVTGHPMLGTTEHPTLKIYRPAPLCRVASAGGSGATVPSHAGPPPHAASAPYPNAYPGPSYPNPYPGPSTTYRATGPTTGTGTAYRSEDVHFCQFCRKGFNLEGLESHNKAVHRKCHVCRFFFANAAQLAAHYRAAGHGTHVVAFDHNVGIWKNLMREAGLSAEDLGLKLKGSAAAFCPGQGGSNLEEKEKEEEEERGKVVASSGGGGGDGGGVGVMAEESEEDSSVSSGEAGVFTPSDDSDEDSDEESDEDSDEDDDDEDSILSEHDGGESIVFEGRLKTRA
jgi:hypothetical protein